MVSEGRGCDNHSNTRRVLFSLVLALMVLPVLVELSARGEESVSEDGTG